MPSFARQLRQFRLAKGFTQEELAEKAGLSARGIGDLERGRRRTPRRDTVELLADALELSSAERANLEAAIGSRARQVSREVPTTGLPVHLSSFVGRQGECALLSDLLLRGEVRLLTLTGAAGAGKTRLALEVAQSATNQFTDGVCFVDLASMIDPSEVLTAVATAVTDLPGIPNWIEDDPVRYLRSKQILLVLDNFEQVVAAGPAVSELLGACPRMTALVTSRATLKVSGEHVHEVQPLSLPADTANSSPASILRSSEAVELFVQRARAANGQFDLTDHNASTVAAICRRLDGLPLATELAAARVRMLTADELLRGLENPFALLRSGTRDAPARHRALVDALEWSYQLLAMHERRMFTWLAVFAGGCDLDAATALLSDTNAAGDEVECLSALVDSSLVRSWEDPRGRRRFGMLATLKAYALELLEASGEVNHVRQLHARYYLRLAESAVTELLGPNQSDWYKMLEVEHANFRAALEWSRKQGDADLGLQLGGALWRSWEARNRLDEGLTWLETFLEMDADGSSPFRAEALNGAGLLACALGRYGKAEGLHYERLRVQQQNHDGAGIEQTFNSLGVVAMRRGDYEDAEGFLERSLKLTREAGEERRLALIAGNLGATKMYADELSAARLILENNLTLSRRLGMTQEVADTLNNLGLVLLYDGNPGEALSMLGNSLEIAKQSGNGACAIESTRGIGCVMLALGRTGEALPFLLQALRTAYQAGDVRRAVRALDALGCVACEQGTRRRAIVLWAAAESARSTLGIIEHRVERTFHNKWRSRALMLDTAQASAARLAGQTMSLDDAVAYALDDETVTDTPTVEDAPPN